MSSWWIRYKLFFQKKIFFIIFEGDSTIGMGIQDRIFHFGLDQKSPRIWNSGNGNLGFLMPKTKIFENLGICIRGLQYSIKFCIFFSTVIFLISQKIYQRVRFKIYFLAGKHITARAVQDARPCSENRAEHTVSQFTKFQTRLLFGSNLI